MISISGKKWEESKIDKNKIEKINQDFNLSEIVSKIIIRRKFTEEEIYSLNNKIVVKYLRLKYLMKCSLAIFEYEKRKEEVK